MTTWCTVAPESVDAKRDGVVRLWLAKRRDDDVYCGGGGDGGTAVCVSVATAEESETAAISICRRLWFIDDATSFSCVKSTFRHNKAREASSLDAFASI